MANEEVAATGSSISIQHVILVFLFISSPALRW